MAGSVSNSDAGGGSCDGKRSGQSSFLHPVSVENRMKQRREVRKSLLIRFLVVFKVYDIQSSRQQKVMKLSYLPVAAESLKNSAGFKNAGLLIKATKYMPAGSYILLRYGLLIEFIQKFLKSASRKRFKTNLFSGDVYLTDSY